MARERNFLRDNGLLLACLGLFGVFFTGMIVSGAATYNEQQREHGSSEEVTLVGYLKTGDFVEATFDDPRAPWPVRRGGVFLKVYENSLAIAFFALFFASTALHALGGSRAFNDEQTQHGEQTVSVWQYLTTSQFWFESMQNWQSEFIAVAAIVGLSIIFRQRGSAESKPVADPHRETGA